LPKASLLFSLRSLWLFQDVLLGRLYIILALADFFHHVTVPGARFLNKTVTYAQVDQLAQKGNTSPYKISNSACLKGGATLFLTTFTRFHYRSLLRLFNRPDATNIQSHRSVKFKRVPPVVVSGLPNITPIFILIWLIKITSVLERLILPVNFRRAWTLNAPANPYGSHPYRLHLGFGR